MPAMRKNTAYKKTFQGDRKRGWVYMLSSMYWILDSVPDPNLIISDPDTKIDNQEFQIHILLWTRDGGKKLSILVNMKTQMGWSLQPLNFFKYFVWNYDEFGKFINNLLGDIS